MKEGRGFFVFPVHWVWVDSIETQAFNQFLLIRICPNRYFAIDIAVFWYGRTIRFHWNHFSKSNAHPPAITSNASMTDAHLSTLYDNNIMQELQYVVFYIQYNIIVNLKILLGIHFQLFRINFVFSSEPESQVYFKKLLSVVDIFWSPQGSIFMTDRRNSWNLKWFFRIYI